jgi:hypothetical protein
MRWLIVALLLAAPPGRKSSRDRTMLQLIERETQIANLLTAGRLAWDAGDYAVAAARWEALLKIEGLPADVEKSVKPFAVEARSRAKRGGSSSSAGSEEEKPVPPAPKEPPRPPPITVAGTISGGGSIGPGGAVITLLRTDGATPKPRPQASPLLQKGKKFVPHVLAVTAGSTVDFRNEDEIFHDVFSLSPAAAFDTGLHKGGSRTPVKFERAGVIELLCNIHATMLGYVVVVDTPWYAVSDGNGAFQVPNVPPGEYEVTVWHESANEPLTRKVMLPEALPLAFTVAADRRADPFPPDKYGKPRQQQLGY